MSQFTDKDKILITAALPYANGRQHIGHARSTYIPADIYKRHCRKRGSKAIYVCGTDDHGTPITVKAEEEGKQPEAIAAKYHQLDEEVYERLNIDFDIFSSTDKLTNHRQAQAMFAKLREGGYIEERETEIRYCPQCEKSLPDRYVYGECPHCGYEEARGDECDKCGRFLSSGELINPRCSFCDSATEKRTTNNYFFKLSQFSDFLRDFYKQAQFPGVPPTQLENQYLSEGLKDIDITRNIDWGVPVLDKEDQVFYVWFDAPIGYISFTKELTSDWEDYWKQGKGKIIHFIGKGIFYHHGVFWPSVLKAAGYSLPDVIAAYSFLTLEGKNMSKSRGHCLYLDEFLDNYPADYLRYYLTIAAPLDRDMDFTWQSFQERINDELIANLGNFVHRILSYIASNYAQIPDKSQLTAEDREMLETAETAVKQVTDLLDNYHFHQALKKIRELSSQGNKYFQEQKVWATENENRVKSVLWTCASIVKTLALLIEPFLPQTAEKIYDYLEEGESVHQDQLPTSPRFDLSGRELEPDKIEPLFQLIEDEQIERELKKVAEPGGANNLKDKTQTEQQANQANGDNMSKISFEEFQELDLRTGKILEAKEHPNADKLLLLTVEIGDETKQSVAGLKEHYQPEELAGKKVVVVNNLEEAELRGETSECMILAAVTPGEDEVVVINSEKELATGLKVQ